MIWLKQYWPNVAITIVLVGLLFFFALAMSIGSRVTSDLPSNTSATIEPDLSQKNIYDFAHYPTSTNPSKAQEATGSIAVPKTNDVNASDEGTVCNGKFWRACSSGEKFICPKEGEAICVPDDNILCNDKYWDPCGSGQKFYCPVSGDAQCQSENSIPGFKENTILVISPNVEERKIVLEANVNLLCYVNSSDPLFSFNKIAGGSGIIISPDGYILTARHVIDGPYRAQTDRTLTQEEIDLYSRYKLDYCEVGVPAISANKLNDVQLNYMKPPYQYVAHVDFVPLNIQGLSETEKGLLDFAILKIDGYNPEFPSHPSALPESFPYNGFLNGSPAIGEGILTYSYPGFFKDIWTNPTSLRKGIGKILRYYTGDKYYADENIIFDITSDSQIPGSSGGGVFWKGYIAGIIFRGQTNVFERVLSASIILKVLKDAGFSF
ncbi:MAG: serine protease [bacterium]|nr:serine protease [bacterium]